ncbi:UDP-N-acetylmuramoyl-tripeptide--D-alanyl-D-alanine ligase [Lactococcus insecticola]|uniref:UDP-N-acetylmuramoyl-tripeptide--D-alanyl-D-alanine ligase n=1 Tax=Pseudolactococcus insecticola TaxID=2709158 RepID=A0A6A0B7W1_9LACT|nr:UDP-N-acetylmuramoyl-tripeptide--D-alanyl-D-alanine ligase [Lactococcus insecticola]GFH40541.1 UDP-N-acetylmuramoyl-tripeptide--D-alanyl-D-alanine ligase [Lactococcus insecticola]
MNLTLHELASAVSAINDVTKYADVKLNDIEFDSRLIKPGDIFLALKGERDGHDFIDVALKNGASAVITSRTLSDEIPQVVVADTLKAFQDLASYYLEKEQPDVIAITGSNGKTTTKDMTAQILATTYKTYKTQGNYNNEIGLPYTVLHMPESTEKLVLEMGQDHMGDIHLLSTLVRPKLAVITLIGESHLEFFGSRDKIAEGKMQIVDGLVDDGELIAPANKLINRYLPENQAITRFGEDADIYLSALYEHKDYLTFSVNFLDEDLTIPVPGKFNATNAMVAAYIGKHEGVSQANIKQALAKLELTKNRVEWRKASNGADILSDVYNANPTAMRLILETFQEIPANQENGKKIAVLADMKELGEASASLHAGMLTAINPEKLDMLYLYGEEMLPLAELVVDIFPRDTVKYFYKDDKIDEQNAMILSLLENLGAHDQILLKGSNSMRLAEVVKALENHTK